MSAFREKTAAFISLGCKVNQTEIEGLTELFRQAGYAVAETLETQPEAQTETQSAIKVLLVNTCAVTAVAAGKSRRVIRQALRRYPEAIVAVMGCYSQLDFEEVRDLGAHVVVGTRERGSLLEAVEAMCSQDIFTPVCRVAPYDKRDLPPAHMPASVPVPFEELPILNREKRVRATVKVQDGCSQWCSYCCVPLSRGPSRSRRPEQVFGEIDSLLANGHKEIVLTGIHLGCYGRDLGFSLADLVERAADAVGIVRLRLSSLEPTEIDDSLLEVLAAHKSVICPHFHIPLQSGSDRILRLMNRPYNCKDYMRARDSLCGVFPDAAITTDIMAGFPGETDAEAKASLDMIAACAFAGVHAFAFSSRPGTEAADFPGHIGAAAKADRVKALVRAGRQTRSAYLGRFYGRTLEVLWERVDEKGARGHTRNYIDVHVPAALCNRAWRSGDVTEIELTPFLVREEQ